jgi:hypothetical protein
MRLPFDNFLYMTFSFIPSSLRLDIALTFLAYIKRPIFHFYDHYHFRNHPSTLVYYNHSRMNHQTMKAVATDQPSRSCFKNVNRIICSITLFLFFPFCSNVFCFFFPLFTVNKEFFVVILCSVYLPIPWPVSSHAVSGNKCLKINNKLKGTETNTVLVRHDLNKY